MINANYVGITKYRYVCEYIDTKTKVRHYTARINLKSKGLKMCKSFFDLKEAALCIDNYLINKGEQPVNILKKCLK